MHPNSRLLPVALLLLAIGSCGCGRRHEEKPDGASPAESPPSQKADTEITFTKETRGRATVPVVATHPDPKVRDELNRRIGALFAAGAGGETDYELERNHRLLIVTRRTLPGAAGEYGATSRDTFHFDLDTGDEYTLGDLVLDEGAFGSILRKLVQERIDSGELDPKVLSALSGSPKNLPYSVGRTALRIVLRSGSVQGGDLAEHHLSIPYGEFGPVLRVQGAFWKAFEKKLLTRRQLRELARKAVSGYVSSFAEAVNTRDFGKISPYLLKDDNPRSFYRIQEKLLQHYEKKKISLRLDGFRVVALQDVIDGVGENQYRAFTQETFTIDYKRRRTTSFHWEYTLEYMADEDRFTLTDIEKWEPGEGVLRAEAANSNAPAPPTVAGSLKKKVIRLTFDDGPNRRVTEGILDALLKHGYKATFFMLAPNMLVNVALLKRMKAEGHTLALHGATHDHKLYRSGRDLAIVESMNEANDVLNNLVGLRSWICRVPYGSARNLTPAQLGLLRSNGYRVWDWNIDSLDTSPKTSSARVLSHTRDELKRRKGEIVVLMHDNVFTLQALPEILEFISQNQWEVEPISPDFVGRVFIDRTI